MNNLDQMKVVLSVVDLEYPNDIQVAEIASNRNLMKKAIKLAERNGLYYYFIRRLKELGADISLSEKDRWKVENQKMSEFKETIMLLNNISKDSGIEYILIKACTTVPHVPRDVDIFVNMEKREGMLKAFENRGMKYDQKSDVETSLRKEGYLRIDIYSKICYFTVDFFKDNFLWESITKSKMLGIEYPSLNKEADFLLLLVHSLFGHRSISLLDFLHIKSLRNEIDVDTCRKCAFENGWASVFDLYLRKLDALHKRIYDEQKVIRFPYIFDQNFILECVSKIEGLRLNKFNKVALRISLILDKIRESQKNSALYTLLKSFEPTRKLINYFISFVRAMRGDKKG